MSFNQYRTNPGANVSNFKGRTDTPKAWPSTAVSTWMNSALFGSAGRQGWIAVLKSGTQDQAYFGGGAVDSNDDIYCGGRNNGGYTRAIKISGGDVPAFIASSKENTNSDYGDLKSFALVEVDGNLIASGMGSTGLNGYITSYGPVSTTGDNTFNPQGARDWTMIGATTNGNNFYMNGHQNLNQIKTAAKNSEFVTFAWTNKNSSYQPQWGAISLRNYASEAHGFYGDSSSGYVTRSYYYEPLDRYYMSGTNSSPNAWFLMSSKPTAAHYQRSRVTYSSSSMTSARRCYWTPSAPVGSDHFGYLLGFNNTSGHYGVEICKVSAVASSSLDGAVIWSKRLAGPISAAQVSTRALTAQPVSDADGNVYFSFSYYSDSGAGGDSKWHHSISKVSPSGALVWCNDLLFETQNGSTDYYANPTQMEINSFGDIIVSGRVSTGTGVGNDTRGYVSRLDGNGGGTGAQITMPGGHKVQYTPNTELGIITSSMVKSTLGSDLNMTNPGNNSRGQTDSSATTVTFQSSLL